MNKSVSQRNPAEKSAMPSPGSAAGGSFFQESASKKKLAEGSVGFDILFTPKQGKPVCNSSCSHCYYFANYGGSDAKPPVSAEKVPSIMAQLKEIGYGKFYLITSELLLADNWKEIISASRDNYVNTNGRIIVEKGQALLIELFACGIRQVVLTANITPSHSLLNFTPKKIVEAAAQEVRSFNKGNAGKRFSLMLSIIVTSENFNKIGEMCGYAKDVCGANVAKFLALIPFSNSDTKLSPSPAQLSKAISQLKAMRKKYPAAEFYIERGGTLGTAGLRDEKKSKFCPAGERMFTIKTLENGGPVSPCIYTPSISIGRIENGKPLIDRALYRKFMELKKSALLADRCPAYALANKLL